MPRSLTIVVGGYIVGYPLGGMTWHHLNYLLGLHELGHEVWFLEDSGEYGKPYNPTTDSCDADPTYGIDYLQRTFAEYNLPPRWCYYSQFWDTHYGLSRDELDALLKRADLLICVSGVTPLRDERPRPRRTLVIDTDPVFTQLKMQQDRPLLDYYRRFNAVATFGRLIGTSHCPLPTHGLRWIATNQPVALRHWPVAPPVSRSFTTVGKWEHAAERKVEFAGRTFLSDKSIELMKLIELPRRTSWRMELGMAGMPADTRTNFESHGWSFTDPQIATASCSSFQQFVKQSAGEFTVVKQIYSGLPSGWFSDRSACYLASGRPVVTQDSGFQHWLTAGEGLFAFENVDQAADALAQVSSDYSRHSAAARRIAVEYFDSEKVLRELLGDAL